MRTKLARLEGKKSTYSGTVKRFGWRRFMGQYVGKTVLLVHIKDKDGKEVTDHLWFKMGKGFNRLNLEPGDAVLFEAKVGTYERGRDSDNYDYKLEYPQKLRKVAPDTLREEGQTALDTA